MLPLIRLTMGGFEMRIIVRLGLLFSAVLGLACQQQTAPLAAVQHECSATAVTNPYYLKYRFTHKDKSFDAAIKFVLDDTYFYPREEFEVLQECEGQNDCFYEEVLVGIGTLYVKNLSADTSVEEFHIKNQFMWDWYVYFGDGEYEEPYDNRWRGRMTFPNGPTNGSPEGRTCCELKFVDAPTYNGGTGKEWSGEKLQDLTAAEWQALTGEDS